MEDQLLKKQAKCIWWETGGYGSVDAIYYSWSRISVLVNIWSRTCIDHDLPHKDYTNKNDEQFDVKAC